MIKIIVAVVKKIIFNMIIHIINRTVDILYPEWFK